MIPVERELDRTLTLLRNKIREQGFTQLQVQAQLSWGRSYISQLLTKQKSLRVEQVLRILQVIGVEPADFYRELYRFPEPDGVEAGGAYAPVRRGEPGIASEIAQTAPRDGFSAERKKVEQSLLQLAQMLVDKQLISEEDRASLDLDAKVEDEDAAN